MSKATFPRNEIAALTAYHVPDAAGMVKLDAMENPYSFPRELREEIAQRLASAPINRYPDPEARALKTALRAEMCIPGEAEIMLGNGSDELIQIIALGLAKPGAVLLGLEPSFSMYPLIAAVAGLRYVGVPLNKDFSLDLPAVLADIKSHSPAVIFIAYPNNPTGNLFPEAALLAIVKKAPGLVVIDEAYHAFAEASFLPHLKQFDNLIVLRTLSKQGLAGLRLGFMISAPAWHAYFDKIRLPYNVNSLSQLAALEILRHGATLREQTARLVADRERLSLSLQAIAGVQVFPSRANFILFRVAIANQVFLALKTKGVLIKNLHSSHALLDNCLRVTIGTPEENGIFLNALKESITNATSPS